MCGHCWCLYFRSPCDVWYSTARTSASLTWTRGDCLSTTSISKGQTGTSNTTDSQTPSEWSWLCPVLFYCSEVLRSLRYYLRAQSQGHHTIDHLEERGVERGSAIWSFLKDKRGPSSIRRTLELFQRQCWGNFGETGWSTYGLFRAHRYYLELDWTVQHFHLQSRCFKYFHYFYYASFAVPTEANSSWNHPDLTY